MTTRRSVITGLLASAAAPVLAPVVPKLEGLRVADYLTDDYAWVYRSISIGYAITYEAIAQNLYGEMFNPLPR